MKGLKGEKNNSTANSYKNSSYFLAFSYFPLLAEKLKGSIYCCTEHPYFPTFTSVVPEKENSTHFSQSKISILFSPTLLQSVKLCAGRHL